VLSLATLAAALNNTMIVVALNTIRTDLDTTLPWVAWVLTAFMLAQSIGFPLAGTLNDLIGRNLSRFLGRENILAVGFDKAEAQAALLACTPETGAANFGDALIAAAARSAGLQEIYPFNRRFQRAGMTPVLPL
jgi:MFS family permease